MRALALWKNNWIPIVLSLIMGMIYAVILLSDKTPQRWYSIDQINTGQVVFENHCASCHGIKAQGLVGDWKQSDADGFLPAPPLNGSAHAWHHDLPLLLEIVQQGGASYHGQMPGFAALLDAQEQLAVIAYFQHYWNNETYRIWQADNGQVAHNQLNDWNQVDHSPIDHSPIDQGSQTDRNETTPSLNPHTSVQNSTCEVQSNADS